MAFEKEVKAAQKVLDQWLARSRKDEEFFIGMKKSGVTWEKDSIKNIEGLIKRKEIKAAQELIEDGFKWLDEYTEQCLEVFKDHEKFILGPPRDGSEGICNTLKLAPNSPAAKEVNKAMAKGLMILTKQFQATQTAWMDDLKPKIEILRSKYNTLEKLAAGSETDVQAYAKQFLRDKKIFEEQMSRAMGEFRIQPIENMIESINKNPNDWAKGIEKARRDQLTNMRKYAAAAESLLKIGAKNYGRVVKSIPAELQKEQPFVKALSEFAEYYKKLEEELKYTLGIYKLAVKTIELNFPELR